MTLLRLIEMLLHRPTPPTDERSRKGERLEALARETAATIQRVDRLVPPAYQSRNARLRAEAQAAQQRVNRR